MFVAIDRWHRTFREVKAWTSPLKVDSVSLSCVEVADGMLQPVIVVFGRGRVRLRQLNTGKSNIRASSCHGPDEFCQCHPTQGASGGVWVSLSAEVDPLVTDKVRAVCWQVVGPDGRGASPEEFMVDNGCHQINGGVVK